MSPKFVPLPKRAKANAQQQKSVADLSGAALDNVLSYVLQLGALSGVFDSACILFLVPALAPFQLLLSPCSLLPNATELATRALRVSM